MPTITPASSDSPMILSVLRFTIFAFPLSVGLDLGSGRIRTTVGGHH
jgi:hypothetical protein